jgi:hypothetical protein
MGLVGVVSRFGAVSAPFVVELKRIHPTLPFGLMGGLAVIAALLCLILPETRGMPTAEVYDNNNGNIFYNCLPLHFSSLIVMSFNFQTPQRRLL